MKRKDRDRDRGMDRNRDIDRGKNIDMVDTVCMVSFCYFSLISFSFRSQKSLFRFEAKLTLCFASKRNCFLLLFLHHFASKRNEQRILMLCCAIMDSVAVCYVVLSDVTLQYIVW
jgi:hypothetical protein